MFEIVEFLLCIISLQKCFYLYDIFAFFLILSQLYDEFSSESSTPYTPSPLEDTFVNPFKPSYPFREVSQAVCI